MKYFIPISERIFNINPIDEIIEKLDKRSENISGIYFGININQFKLEEIQNLYYFLEEYHKKDKEIFIVFNPWQIKLSKEDYDNFLFVSKSFEKYLTGASFTSIHLAKYAKELYPNWKIDLSTNSQVYNVAQLQYWKKLVDPYSINVPRDFLRSHNDFDRYKRYGLKIKAILNECCLYGCPVLNQCRTEENFCTSEYKKLSNILRSNWIPPSELAKIKDNIDIAKIVHRGISLKRILYILDSYISEKDSGNLLKLIGGPQLNNFPKGFYIPLEKIPKKIYSCKCSECHLNCEVCEKFMKKCILDNLKDGIIDEKTANNMIKIL